jgi:hypothetical protein
MNNEDIQIQDGQTENNHELQAAIRIMPSISRGIGERKEILGGDSLFANAPFIHLAHSFKFNF